LKYSSVRIVFIRFESCRPVVPRRIGVNPAGTILYRVPVDQAAITRGSDDPTRLVVAKGVLQQGAGDELVEQLPQRQFQTLVEILGNEYLFVDLGNGSCTTDCAIENANGPPLIPNVAVKFNESVVRAGINYKFGS
jgi:hypothetical protein